MVSHHNPPRRHIHMKVTAEHLANLAQAIEPLDTPERRTAYRNGDFPVPSTSRTWTSATAGTCSGRRGTLPAVPDFLAQYNDSHIDTALRRIVPVLGDGTNDEIVTPEPATEADKRAAVRETATELFGEGAEVQDDGTIAFPEPADEPPTPSSWPTSLAARSTRPWPSPWLTAAPSAPRSWR